MSGKGAGVVERAGIAGAAGMFFLALFVFTVAQAEEPPPAPPPDAGDPQQKLLELEQPSLPAPPPALPPAEPRDRAKERIRQLERLEERQKRKEREQQGPQEKARQRLQTLEQLGPPAPEKKAAQKAKDPKDMPKRRVRFLLGVYEEVSGIYDEILDTTKVGPGLLHDALDAPEWLVVGGEQRTRYEGLNGSWRQNEPNGGQLISHRTRLQIGVENVLDPVRFLIELQDSRASLYTTGAYINDNNVNEIDIQQLHVDLVSKSFLGTGVPTVLKVGRINMDLGRGRWVARNQFRNATNAFDGVQWQLGDERRWQVRSFVVKPVTRFLKQLDPSAFPDGDHTFWGTYLEWRRLPWLETTFHYFGHASTGPHRDFSMLGGRARKRAAVGEFDYELESSYQFGDISAAARFGHFQHGEIGYTFDLPWTPQVLLKFDYASNGFDVLYGRRSFELHPTGIFGPFQRSNLVYPGYRILVKPTEQVYAFFQHRAAWLADARGAWVGTGLQDPTGASGNFIGQSFEVRARWGITENVALQAGYAHLTFGPFAKKAPGSPVTHDADYGYLWTEFMF